MIEVSGCGCSVMYLDSPTDLHSGGKREILVRIEHTGVPKPFLGGYRNRRTGLEYHNAAIQTLPKKRPDKGVSVDCKEQQIMTS